VNTHAELIGCISANHVLNDEAATWVNLLPCVEPKHIVVINDQSISGGDAALDLSAGENALIGHGCLWRI
jgi:hypothetical protein